MKFNSFTFSAKQQLFTLLFFAVALNLNTLFHEYVLDDIVVLTENKFVVKGVKGIPEILTTDLMSGYSAKENLLSEPRYRPLSIVVFAIEYEMFGANPFVSHLMNVLLFALLVLLLFKLLREHIFKDQHQYLAFFTCLLFSVHPIHTEVIANVKSRDELIAYIFLVSSLIALVKYVDKRSVWMLVIGLLCFFLALLTRESAVTFIAVFPVILYFFYNQSIKKSILFSIPLLIVFSAFMVLRYSIIGFSKPIVTDILNAPYLYATASQAFATKFFVLLKYILLLIFPHPLSSDYSYNQIPYIELGSFQFVFSFAVIISMLLYALLTFQKRTLLSFSIIYFTITISLVANFIVDIGTPLSERLLFQPSLAFCIAVAFLFLKYFEKFKEISSILMLLIFILFSAKTILRNSDWKSNDTLFMADVISAPNSARTTLYATEVYRMKAKFETNLQLKKEYYDKAAYYGERSIKIHPKFAVTYLNLGFVYYYQSDFNKAAEYWLKGYELAPEDTEAVKCVQVLSGEFYRQGNGLFEHGRIEDAIQSYLKSTELNPSNMEAWYNLGGNYFLKGDSISAKMAWDKVRALDPGHVFRKEEFLNN